MSSYDYGYKDGAISGYKLAIDDINERLTGLGLKKNVEFKNTKEAVDTFITLVEFYKLAYERALNEIAEGHGYKNMTCMEIVIQYMKEKGFDGMQNGAECGCCLPDLAPCESDFSQCTPGYKVIPPKGSYVDFDFYICQNKSDKPWEAEE